MKRTFRTMLAAGAAATLMACSTAAMAASAPTSPRVAVQLDGRELSFTDAQPQVMEGRIFVPFRAVFEALGAEVSANDTTITAKRGGRTVTMTTGSRQAAIEQDGSKRTLEMDVAPYVDQTSWRTYVPLRFASQSFDCAVGWDSDEKTAVIVDVATMLDEAMEGKQYTCLEKYMEYAQQFNTGIWDAEVKMNGEMTVTEDSQKEPVKIPLTMNANGTTSGQTQVEMNANMTMDLSSLVSMAQDDPAQAMAMAQICAMFKDGIDVQTRGDLAKNVMYMNMSSKALEDAGLSADTWYKMDLAELLDFAPVIVFPEDEDMQPEEGEPMDEGEGSRSDPADMADKDAPPEDAGDRDDGQPEGPNDESASSPVMGQSVGVIGGADGPTAIFMAGGVNTSSLVGMDPMEMVTSALSSTELESVNDYAKIKEAVEYVAELLSDESFVKENNKWVLTVEPEGDIPEESFKFVLTLDVKSDKVVGYAVDLNAKVDGQDPASMTVKMAVDESNKVSGEMRMALASMMDARFTITGQYKKGTKAPETEPPANAKVVPFEDLMDGNRKIA